MNVTKIDRDDYEFGFTKLEQLEALLLLASSLGPDGLTQLVRPAQSRLTELAYELAADARCALSKPAV